MLQICLTFERRFMKQIQKNYTHRDDVQVVQQKLYNKYRNKIYYKNIKKIL